MLPRTVHRFIARLALAWFALALGVAAASPLVQPRAMQLVCSAGGAVKLLVDSGDGWVESGPAHPLDCALCLLADAPPSHTAGATPAPVAAPSAPHAPRATAPRVALAGAPLPARGPPAFS